MSKRIILQERELDILEITLKEAIKSDKYHIEHSLIVGKLGQKEMVTLLKKLGRLESATPKHMEE